MKRIPFYVALAVLCLAMTDCTSKKKMEIKMKPYPQTAKVDVSDIRAARCFPPESQ